jgi:hypothetical protein
LAVGSFQGHERHLYPDKSGVGRIPVFESARS